MGGKKRKWEREETQLGTALYNTRMQCRHHFCNDAQHLVKIFFFIISTEVHRHILKFRLWASSSSSAGVHSYSTGSLRRHQAAGQCSALHSFSSTPTHSTFFSLDCSPLCPIYCFTAPAVLPPKPKIVTLFVSSLLFISNFFQPLPFSPEVLPQPTFSRPLFHIFALLKLF